jgi:cell division protein FtsI/penicillin-binding protein 2
MAQASAMQTSKLTINPTRGRIFVRDHNGELAPLVLNQTVFTVFADPSQVKDSKKVREILQKNAPNELLENNLTDKKLTEKDRQYLVLARQVTNAQVQAIKQENLAGIGFQTTTRRVYPEGNLAAQALGFVNADGLGQYGIEQYLNDELTGKAGLLQAVTDVRRIPLTIGASDVNVPVQDGADYVLTIDRSVQLQAEQLLQKGMEDAGVKTGSILVMNPQNGQIMAMADYPTYNPAEYNKVEDGAVFQNRTTSYSFEPGSVMKTLTTGVALDQGKITPSTTFRNTGCLMIDDARICNLSRQVDGRTMTMTEVLQWSLNTGVIWQLEQIGGGEINRSARDTFYKYLTENYRFGSKTGIEQSNEALGKVNSPDITGARVNYANMTFGQGMTVTMIQFASAFSAAINGGTYYQPTLIHGVLNENNEEKAQEPKILAQSILSEEASRNLEEMIYEARRLNNATAYDGFYVGAKTGTAQLYDAETGRYSDTKTTGTAIGFGADKDKTPRYVIMIRLDEYEQQGSDTTGGTQALRIFDKMANYLNQYKGLSK